MDSCVQMALSQKIETKMKVQKGGKITIIKYIKEATQDK